MDIDKIKKIWKGMMIGIFEDERQRRRKRSLILICAFAIGFSGALDTLIIPQEVCGQSEEEQAKASPPEQKSEQTAPALETAVPPDQAGKTTSTETAGAPVETPSSEVQSQEGVTIQIDTDDADSSSSGEQLVSLDFKDADIAEVLSALAKAYGLNIIAGKEITGRVSINLTDVTLEDALKAVLGLNKYTYTRDKNIITILAAGDQLSTEVLRLQFGNASEVKDLFKNTLSERGDMRVNERLNEIIITDTPEVISKARELLYRVDSPPPQVVIEAKLVDIDPKDLASFGLDWNVNYQGQTGKEDRTFKTSFDYNQSRPSNFLSGEDIVWKYTTPFFTPENKATIDYLIQETKANLLSAPRIAVLNNQPAKIVIGEKVGIREQTQTASGTIESVRFVDVGITLKVTPQINEGGYVSMEISTEVSSVGSFVDNLPRITTREATTHVRVKDRETIVIAGLLKDEYSESDSHFPFLQRIPIIGKALGKFGNSRELKELVIFITPNILATGDRVNPDDTEKLKRQQTELDGVKVKHDEMISLFRKGGIKDATALNTAAYYTDEENLFERGQWYERMAETKFRPAKYKSIKEEYWYQAAVSYKRFAEARPTDSRAALALNKSASIYDDKLKDIQAAYDIYRLIATRYADSPYADRAVGRMKKINKELDKQVREREKHKSKIEGRLKGLGIEKESTAEEIKDIQNAQIPLSSS